MAVIRRRLRHVGEVMNAGLVVAESEQRSRRPPAPRGGRAMTRRPAEPAVSAADASGMLAQHLAAVAAQRDTASFIVLFDYYAPRVKAYVKRLGAGDSVAEDLAQEVMLTVWRKAGQYDPAKAAVGTWIFTIARNARIDALRRERRPELDPNDPSLAPEAPPAPDAGIDSERSYGRIRRALRNLPAEQAEVVALSFYRDKSHGEIAATLGIPLGTVKSRLRLAFQRVRGIVGDLT